jgi:hypothetical protein
MKLSNLTYGFLALILAVISSNSQERGRGDRERGSRDAQWAREAMERLRGSDRVNPLDPEAVKRRLDYAVREGLMTREQADKMMVDAKKRMEVAQREDDARRGRESQSNDRQDQVRKDYEARRKRIEEGVKSGKIKREDAVKMYEGLRKWMEGASRGGDNPRTNQRQGDDRRRVDMESIRKRVEEGVRRGRIKREDAGRIIEGIRKRVETAQRGNGEVRTRESQSNDRQADARKGYEIRRKRIEEGVKSGKIKREDAAKMLAELRKRMEAANRGGGDKKEESKEDPRLERYRAAERHFAGEVKAGKLSKEDAQKKLIEVRKRLWGGENARANQQRGGDRGGDGAKRESGEKRPDQRPQSKNSKSNPRSRDSQAKSSQSRDSSRGYLGVAVESSSKPKGLRIGQVYANTAAARAKLKKGDIILKMNGAGVTSNSGLIGRLSTTKPGQKATLLISSGGKTRTVQVQLGEAYSTRSSAQSSSSRSRDSQSSQSKKPQTKGKDHDHAKGERGKKDHEQDRVQHLKQAIGHLRAAGRHDLAEEIEKRMHEAHHNQDKHRHDHNDHKGHGNHDRRDRGDEMRKAWEERMKQWREARERAERDSRGRDNDRGEQMRRAMGEWVERMRDMRERVERDSRGRGNDRGRNDRGEDMRKVWEERMKQWREARERDGDRDGRRSEMQRGPQGRGPGAQHGPDRGRGPQGRGPGSQRGPQWGRGPQSGGPWRGGLERGRGSQGRGPGRSDPQGR